MFQVAPNRKKKTGSQAPPFSKKIQLKRQPGEKMVEIILPTPCYTDQFRGFLNSHDLTLKKVQRKDEQNLIILKVLPLHPEADLALVSRISEENNRLQTLR
jgi:predicted metal-dependent hydrolase